MLFVSLFVIVFSAHNYWTVVFEYEKEFYFVKCDSSVTQSAYNYKNNNICDIEFKTFLLSCGISSKG